MREIKFRAWNTETKEMREVQRINTKNGQLLFANSNLPTKKGYSHKYIVMQYTGLKDADGKGVYEGDILEFVAVKTKWIVNYRNGAFTISYQNSNINILYDCAIEDGILTHMKIIGNIYENPELLKQGISKENLDKRICDCENRQTNTQTYRDFIRESEEEFSIAPAPIDEMDEEELKQYLNFMDELWNK